MKLDLDTDIGSFNHTVIFYTIVGAQHPYYAQFGEKHYATIYKDDEFGTACIKDGEIIAFYPDVTNVYEKDGTLYGILSEGEAAIDTKYFYGQINADGTFEKLFRCWSIFYFEDKIYFYESTSKSNDDGLILTNVYTANIDGSEKQIVLTDIPVSFPDDRIYCYKNQLICQGNFNDIYVMSSDGTTNKVVDGGYVNHELEFVNNGFVYYTKTVTVRSQGLNNVGLYNYSLWRVGLDGENREQLFAKDVSIFPYHLDAVAFAGKLLLFLTDGVHVYTDSMANCTTYEYEKFSYDEIVQISVYNGQLCVVGNIKGSRNHQTIVYDSNGDITFEYGF